MRILGILIMMMVALVGCNGTTKTITASEVKSTEQTEVTNKSVEEATPKTNLQPNYDVQKQSVKKPAQQPK